MNQEYIPPETSNPHPVHSVLVVDDERLIRLSAREFLRDAGYKAEAVESGEKAVELYEQGQRYDLLILDMIMGGIDGCTTYERILEHNPSQKAILTTGFPPKDRLAKIKELGIETILDKPINKEQLLETVANELA
jgi:CheY-like chemotaxis protein